MRASLNSRVLSCTNTLCVSGLLLGCDAGLLLDRKPVGGDLSCVLGDRQRRARISNTQRRVRNHGARCGFETDHPLGFPVDLLLCGTLLGRRYWPACSETASAVRVSSRLCVVSRRMLPCVDRNSVSEPLLLACSMLMEACTSAIWAFRSAT